MGLKDRQKSSPGSIDRPYGTHHRLSANAVVLPQARRWYGANYARRRMATVDMLSLGKIG